MTISPQQCTPIRTEHDLRERWQNLMGHDGFGRRSLWLIFLDERGRQADVIVPIDDIPMLPDRRDVRAIKELVGRVREETGMVEVPMLLSRPGPAYITEGDRLWAIALTQAMHDQHPRWPIHLATPQRVHVFAPDDLIAA